jgi:histidinol-phosphate aminotransferase
VAIDCGRDAAFAAAVLDELLARDVFARKPASPGLDRCIRVSCGLDAELDLLAEVLPQAVAAARSRS